MGLIANIYRAADRQDCTNGGWSSQFSRVCIINCKGPFEPSDDCPGVILVRHRVKSLHHVYAVSAEHEGCQVMMGGNFLHSSDSRFSERVRELAEVECVVGAISIHDRIE